MQQETLVTGGLIVALTIAYGSALRVSPQATPWNVAESPGAGVPVYRMEPTVTRQSGRNPFRAGSDPFARAVMVGGAVQPGGGLVSNL